MTTPISGILQRRRSVREDKKNKPVADVPVTWTSSNPKVASVEAGAVTAEKKGNVKITAAAGKKTATAKVTVK